MSCVRFKRIPDPGYVLTALVFSYGYYVKTACLFSPVRVVGQKPRSGTGDFVLFGPRYRICTTAVTAVFPVLHLHEDEDRLVFHDQVNFAEPATEIPV